MNPSARCFVVLALLFRATGFGAPPRHPFPQHVSYAAGSIAPSHRTQAQLDDDIRTAYALFKSNYVAAARSGPAGEPRYRIRFGLAPPLADETVSEGQGYGMVILALMAGHDPDAQTIFDGLWRFAHDHPSRFDASQMDYHVPKDEAPSGTPGGDDPFADTSAFDGDCDIAYALLLADAQWGSAGAIDYRAEAARVLGGLLASVVGPDSHLPLLGDSVSHPPHPPTDPGYPSQYTPRSSDFMPGHFRAFQRHTGLAEWGNVYAASQAVITSLQTNFAQTTGLLPDFIVPTSGTDHTPRPAPGMVLESPNDGFYYYNAGRDPWRIGTDALLNGDAVSRSQARKMAQWIVIATGGMPANISPGYRLDGTRVNPDWQFTSFFAAPFGVAAMLEPSQQQWLNALYDTVRLNNGAPRVENYYEDTVTLLCMLVMTRNFWDPSAAPGCTASPRDLCLRDGRFRLSVTWRNPYGGGSMGAGMAVPMTSDTGYFWFFTSNNVELVVKVVDGRAFNGRFWVFYGALSNVEYTITVTDTQTGAVKTYVNPSGQLASVADTAAF